MNAELVSKINEALFDKLSDIYDDADIGESEEQDSEWCENVIAALKQLVETYEDARNNG